MKAYFNIFAKLEKITASKLGQFLSMCIEIVFNNFTSFTVYKHTHVCFYNYVHF